MAHFPARGQWADALLSEDGPSTSRARLVGCALVKHAHKDGRGVWPSERLLAIETRLARNTVRSGIDDLAKEGWIEKRALRRGQYGQTVFAYDLVLPEASIGPIAEPLKAQANESQWSIAGSGIGSANGSKNGSPYGTAIEPESKIQNPKSKNQEIQVLGEQAPDLLAITIDQLEFGREAILICQKARPGADPLDIIRKFRKWGRGRSAACWQHSLATFATKERLADDEIRAEQKAICNRVEPRRPGEPSSEFARRAADPQIHPEFGEAFKTTDDCPF